MCEKLTVTLWDPRKVDGIYEDQKKLRVDSPARSNYTCMLKYYKNCWGARADGGFLGDKGQGATDQEKMGAGARSRESQLEKVMRSGLADGETWRQIGKRYSVVATEEGKQEVIRSGLVDKERWR